MAKLHTRSNSLPSDSHPVVTDVQEHLHRLKSSEGTSTSVCADLASLRDLHEGINSLFQMPSIQDALSAEGSEKWTTQLLEESLGLVDLCGFAREVLILSKDSIQELQSSVRRNRDEASVADAINAYTTSRKKISKMISKFIKNFNRKGAFSSEDLDAKAVIEMLKETFDIDFSVLKSVLMVLSGEEGKSKKRSGSLLSKLAQPSRIKIMDAADVQNFLKHQKSTEVDIQEIDEELEAYYRTQDFGFNRNMLQSAKESVQGLQSSMRRDTGEIVSEVGVNSYVASRKLIKKCDKDMKIFNENSSELRNLDLNLDSLGKVLKEADTYAFRVYLY